MSDAPAQGDEHREFEDLLVFIRDSRGFDFTGYKRSSLARRIHKRMAELGAASHADYRDLLEADAEEFRTLFNTVLINVTGFMRDGEAWTYLQREIVPQAVADDGEIRVWSAGCSTGAEAYSAAIIFAEVMGIEECVKRLKIYGTDVDDEALQTARTGTYSAKALRSLPPQLVEKYFDTDGEDYSFRADLRRRVIFGRHDITRDAPISRLSLLICRNTLMYFNAQAQTDIVDRFHFALKPAGHLFLGKAEMLLSDGDRFEAVNMKNRVFRRRAGESRLQHAPQPARPESAAARESRAAGRRRAARDLTLETAPNAMITLDADGVVVMFNAQARALFGLMAHDLHRPFRDLELSYRPLELRALVEQAESEHRSVQMPAAQRRLPTGETQYLDVLVQPLSTADRERAGVSLTFVDCTATVRLQNEVQRIRQDLATAYEALQSTNEELETTNEELQSSIEELETTNEELQSTNEELETTNEELESGNEELQAVNDQLRSRSAELDEAHAFLTGVLASIGAGVVVLDAGSRVRSWNTRAEDLWGLRAAEVELKEFFALDFGLPTAELREAVEQCRAAKTRVGPIRLAAINRIGRAITCSVICSPLHQPAEGLVLLMEEADRIG